RGEVRRHRDVLPGNVADVAAVVDEPELAVPGDPVVRSMLEPARARPAVVEHLVVSEGGHRNASRVDAELGPVAHEPTLSSGFGGRGEHDEIDALAIRAQELRRDV